MRVGRVHVGAWVSPRLANALDAVRGDQTRGAILAALIAQYVARERDRTRQRNLRQRRKEQEQKKKVLSAS